MEKFKIAILTKSNKRRRNGQYGCCIAGITEDGEWIRLVADKDGDSLPENIEIQVWQVVLAYGERAPLTYQTENVVLDHFDLVDDHINKYIRNLQQITEVGIFGNTSNRLSQEEMCEAKGTLRWIKVQNLEIYWNEHNSCRVLFDYNGNYFEGISMTDPKQYTNKGSSPKQIGEAHIVVSLPDSPAFNKFVAAIFPSKRNS